MLEAVRSGIPENDKTEVLFISGGLDSRGIFIRLLRAYFLLNILS